MESSPLKLHKGRVVTLTTRPQETSTLSWVRVVNVTPRPLYWKQNYTGLWMDLQDRYGRTRKISPIPRFDFQIVQAVASRYTDCAISAHPENIGRQHSS